MRTVPIAITLVVFALSAEAGMIIPPGGTLESYIEKADWIGTVTVVSGSVTKRAGRINSPATSLDGLPTPYTAMIGATVLEVLKGKRTKSLEFSGTLYESSFPSASLIRPGATLLLFAKDGKILDGHLYAIDLLGRRTEFGVIPKLLEPKDLLVDAIRQQWPERRYSTNDARFALRVDRTRSPHPATLVKGEVTAWKTAIDWLPERVLVVGEQPGLVLLRRPMSSPAVESEVIVTLDTSGTISGHRRAGELLSSTLTLQEFTSATMGDRWFSAEPRVDRSNVTFWNGLGEPIVVNPVTGDFHHTPLRIHEASVIDAVPFRSSDAVSAVLSANHAFGVGGSSSHQMTRVPATSSRSLGLRRRTKQPVPFSFAPIVALVRRESSVELRRATASCSSSSDHGVAILS